MCDFKSIEALLNNNKFSIVDKDFDRPWGGFFVVDESQAQIFSNYFFEGLDIKDLKVSGKLSPKILVVKPESRLSWQYHERRSEIWKVFKGKAGIIRSKNDTENNIEILNEGDQIILEKGERHRLIGLESTAVIAEIWRHTDPNNPSDENDIIRVQDDYGR